MKKTAFLLASIILMGFTINASAETIKINKNKTATYYGNNGHSFIFNENGIEFSVFKDGQFDFNIIRNNSRFGAHIQSKHINLSFNSGYNYNAYIQYDAFGAIIQIENTPIYYDYYGRINQAGNIHIYYNNFGHINRIGGLYIHYNRFNEFTHHTGFINVFNRRYVYKPRHRFYSIPTNNYCVVNNNPYRQFYTPVRYTYRKPFYNNYRPRTRVLNRRGYNIERDRRYATVNRNTGIIRNETSRRRIANNNLKRKHNKIRTEQSNKRNNRAYGIQQQQKSRTIQKSKNTNTYSPKRNRTQIVQRRSIEKPRTIQQRSTQRYAQNRNVSSKNTRSPLKRR